MSTKAPISPLADSAAATATLFATADASTSAAQVTTPDVTTPDVTTLDVAAPEQLTLLPVASIPLQFRLDERTRRSGLEHVARLRAQIAAQAAKRNGSVTGIRPPRRQIAA